MDDMTYETKEALACSLRADATELLPFSPCFLQDFGELGSDPEVMIRLTKNHVPLSLETRALDLACGKGAVSVKIAEHCLSRTRGNATQTEKDTEEILRLQYTAYQSEAAIYNNYSIQPLTQTIEQAKEEFTESTVLKAVAGAIIIGSVWATMLMACDGDREQL